MSPEFVRGRLSTWMAMSAALVATLGIAREVRGAERDPVEEPPAGYAVGPRGEQLIRSRARIGPSTRMEFRQIAGSSTNGKIVNTLENFNITRLPAAFAATLATGEVCTSTLIGPRVLLIAAHCVDQNFRVKGLWQTVRGRITRADGSNGRQIRSCMLAPAYTASEPQPGSVRNDNDFALCDLAADFRGVRAETISLSPAAVTSGKPLLLAGYGCTNSDLTDEMIEADTPTKAILNVGHNRIGERNQDAWINMAGRVGSKDAIICPGDSGGAAYANVDLNDANDVGWRVVAVNSAVGPSPSHEKGAYISYLADLSDSDFGTFLTSWAAERPNTRKVCGVHLTHLTGNCRR